MRHKPGAASSGNIDPTRYETMELADLLAKISADVDLGNAIDWQQLYTDNPDLAAELKEIRPAMDALQNLKVPRETNDLNPRLNSKLSDQEVLGDFRIVREIGRGGMGVVYEAQQQSILRRVALKILPLAELIDQRALSRFKNEVTAIATMDHPNIVSVYAIGEERGIHYYAMQLIRGQSLAVVIKELRTRLAENTSVTSEMIDDIVSDRPFLAKEYDLAAVERQDCAGAEANETMDESRAKGKTRSSQVTDRKYFPNVVRLIVQAAEALQHSHDHGIVHRDIKPANLLLDKQGKIYVTDFGLARIEALAGVTMTGDVLGTLRYMSPEQVLAGQIVVDHRTDVYSLGATLYELLTLQPIWSGNDRADLITNISFHEPTPPQKINSAIPADLETVVLKAISKFPGDRYDTAQDFADDLQRYLKDLPVIAKRPSIVGRVNKWTRRNPVIMWSTLILMTMLATAAIASSFLISAEQERTSRALAKEKQAKESADKARTFAEEQTSVAQEAKRLSDLHLYIGQIRLSKAEWEYGDPAVAISTLNSTRDALRGWEYDYLLKYFNRDLIATGIGHTDRISCIKFNHAGTLLASGSNDRTIRLWNTSTGQLIHTLLGHTREIRDLDFSPDGKVLVSCDFAKLIRFWKVETGKEFFSIDVTKWGDYSVSRLAFHPNGNKIATGHRDGTFSLWDVGTGEELANFKGHYDHASSFPQVSRIEFNSKGNKIRTTGPDETVRVWDVGSFLWLPKCFLGIEDSSVSLVGDQQRCLGGVAISPNNELAATASVDRMVRIWNAKTGNVIRTLKGHRGYVNQVEFVENGKHVISAGDDKVLRVWDVASGEVVRLLRGHSHRVRDLAVSEDETRIASGSWDHTVKIWRGSKPVDTTEWTAHERYVPSVAISPNGQYLASSSGSLIKVWDRNSQELLFNLKGHTNQVEQVAFGPDGQWLLSCGHDRVLRVWDVASGKPIQVLKGHKDIIVDMAIHAAAKQIVSCGGSEIRIWDFEQWREVGFIKGNWRMQSVAVNPHNTLIVAGCGGRLQFWDKASGDMIHESESGLGWMHSMDFSPDGEFLVTAGYQDGMLRLWDVKTKQQIKCWIAHPHSVKSVTFSPNGKRIISGGADETIKIWDAELGELLLTLDGNSDTILAVEASADGQFIFSGSNDSKLRIWNSRSD